MLRLALISTFLLLSGCSSLMRPPLNAVAIPGCHFCGYNNDVGSDDVIQSSSGTRFNIQNVHGQDRLVLSEAIEQAVAVLISEDFETAMSAREFRAQCGSDEVISGATVLEDLRAIPEINIVIRRPAGAVAQTQIERQRVAISPERLKNWRTDPGALVNTLIHEMTHFVPTGEGFYKYTDRGHGENGCMDEDLASYGTGNLAQTIYEGWR